MLFDLIAAYPEQVASNIRDMVNRKGENGKQFYDQVMGEADVIKSSF